jgi:hypothetical protein
MTVSGNYLYLLVCDSGKIEYDAVQDQGARYFRRTDQFLPNQMDELSKLLGDKAIRNLQGEYRGVVRVRDHWEGLKVTVFRSDGIQAFEAIDLYGDVKGIYPSELVRFLCAVDNMRPHTKWHDVGVALKCRDKEPRASR